MLEGTAEEEQRQREGEARAREGRDKRNRSENTPGGPGPRERGSFPRLSRRASPPSTLPEPVEGRQPCRRPAAVLLGTGPEASGIQSAHLLRSCSR